MVISQSEGNVGRYSPDAPSIRQKVLVAIRLGHIDTVRRRTIRLVTKIQAERQATDGMRVMAYS